MWDHVGRLYAYHGDVPAEVRLLKLTEEVGEVADAFIGMHGLNARKGVCRTRDDLLAELADVIEAMGNPDVLTLGQLIDCALEKKSEAADWLIERKNRRAIPHRMERCGFVSVRNPDAKSDGRWVLQHRKQVVYANAKLSVHDQIAALKQMSKEGE